jgi:hypothetical protein
MALNLAQFQSSLKSIFQSTDWGVFSDFLGDSIASYIESGDCMTTVTATVTPPFPLTPYTASGKGKGSIQLSGTEIMKITIKAKFTSTSTVWADLGKIIGDAIDANVTTGTITTTVSPAYGGILQGTGSGTPGCVSTVAVKNTLDLDLTDAFTGIAFNQSYDAVAIKIASAIDSYIKGSIVTTTDSGTVPVNTWVGTGTGNIQ